MNQSDFKKLDVLRKDYASVAGEPFQTFFCPVLFRDEAEELCRAHLVNQAFVGASRRWTIQRKDVDGFFGAFFESDFVKLQLRRAPEEEPFAILADRDRSRRLEPKVYLDDKRIEHYVAATSRHSILGLPWISAGALLTTSWTTLGAENVSGC